MNLEHTAERSLPLVEAGPSFDEARATLLTLASDVLAAEPQDAEAAADALREALLTAVSRWPAQKMQPVVRGLLDDEGLGAQLDSTGYRLRASFVAAQQGLGFPWALEVDPEDLELLHTRGPRAELPSAFLSVVTFLAGLATLGWDSLAGLLFAMEYRGLAVDLGLPFFALGSVHAVGAMLLSLSDRFAGWVGRRNTLRFFGGAAILGPLASFAMYLVQPGPVAGSMALVALAVAAPSMLTAGLCVLTARSRAQPERN